MKVRALHFNIILLLLVGLTAGCKTTEDKKQELSAIRLHIETSGGGFSGSKTVPIYRAAPAYITVEESPFADERDIAEAKVTDWMDGFAVQLKFTDHGRLLLENTTRLNPNRRIAIFGDFGESRWLAAPLIGRPIGDGRLSFTPDATRAEAERFARGLNEVAAKIRKNSSN